MLVEPKVQGEISDLQLLPETSYIFAVPAGFSKTEHLRFSFLLSVLLQVIHSHIMYAYNDKLTSTPTDVTETTILVYPVYKQDTLW